ncbi:MAG: hypothetical protein K5787_21070 [Lentisphaeria bacterium]|nr:hypothetical protein [Lentisphaeria bacterium]
MKRIVAWITYILNLLVALPVIGVLFFFGAEVNACFSAIICIVLFGLWGYYQYYNVVQKNPCPKGITALKVVLIGVIIAVVVLPLLFFIQNLRPVNIHPQDYEQAIATNKRSSYWLKQKMIPQGATNIEFFHKPGIPGTYAYLKCSCTMEALKEFEFGQQYDFQGDNLFKNTDSDNPEDVNAIQLALEHFHAEEADNLRELKNCLAYNCIHRNGGGVAFLYIVDKQILYGLYAHN